MARGGLAYDLAPEIEPRAGLSAIRDIPLPDLWFGLYEAVLLLDHKDRKVTPDHKDHKDPKEQQGHKDHKDPKV